MNEPTKEPYPRTFVQWFVHLMILFLCVGTAAPGINESHYLPKAKHTWDASFAPGDLFLESHNSHFLAAQVAGALSALFPLAAVAWIGRVVSWALMAWAWLRFSRCLSLPPTISPLALAAWYLAMAYGHWAGEWAIGGFEAKSLAYPCVLLGVVAVLESRWKAVWIWMGLAVAWHPVVGGWAGITVAAVWLGPACTSFSKLISQFRGQLVGLSLGAAIGLVGVVPALVGFGGEDRDGNVVASQVQVFYRLQHHLCPRTFAFERQLAGLASLMALIGATLAWRLQRRSQGTSPQDSRTRLGRLLAIAWAAVGCSVLGLIIDLTLSDPRLPTFQPVLASKLLRLYWFRWSDIAVPLAWTSVLWQLAAAAPASVSDTSRVAVGIRRYGLAAAILTTLLFSGIHWRSNWSDSIAPGDRLMFHSRGPYDVDTDRYVDWLAVCDWIREQTPEDSLWLTPKYQQTFKWYAHRAEVVCWKDVPQDNASILEWYQRIQRCAPPRDSSGKIRGWTTQELVDLHREYGFEWVLVDRTVQADAPLLEIMYPIDIRNRSFAVFRVTPEFIQLAK